MGLWLYPRFHILYWVYIIWTLLICLQIVSLTFVCIHLPIASLTTVKPNKVLEEIPWVPGSSHILRPVETSFVGVLILIRIFQSYKPNFKVFVHVLILGKPCERFEVGVWYEKHFKSIVPTRSAQAMNSEEFKALLKERPLTLRSDPATTGINLNNELNKRRDWLGRLMMFLMKFDGMLDFCYVVSYDCMAVDILMSNLCEKSLR